jgi:hypothetical protein
MRINPVTKVMQVQNNTNPMVGDSFNSPTIPMADDVPSVSAIPQNKEETDEMDIQKELEAKFDELFGPIDDSDSNS